MLTCDSHAVKWCMRKRPVCIIPSPPHRLIVLVLSACMHPSSSVSSPPNNKHVHSMTEIPSPPDDLHMMPLPTYLTKV